MRYENITGLSRSIHVDARIGAALLCALLGTLTMRLAAPADASESADAATTATTSAAGMTEITVTATRREESLSKVPISISAFSQETMDQKVSRTSRISFALRPESPSTRPARMRFPFGVSRLQAARARLASTSTIRPSRCARWDSIPMTRCQKPSTWIVSKCCADRRHSLRRGLRGRNGTLHPDAAQPDERQHVCEERGVVH